MLVNVIFFRTNKMSVSGTNDDHRTVLTLSSKRAQSLLPVGAWNAVNMLPPYVNQSFRFARSAQCWLSPLQEQIFRAVSSKNPLLARIVVFDLCARSCVSARANSQRKSEQYSRLTRMAWVTWVVFAFGSIVDRKRRYGLALIILREPVFCCLRKPNTPIDFEWFRVSRFYSNLFCFRYGLPPGYLDIPGFACNGFLNQQRWRLRLGSCLLLSWRYHIL